MTKTYAFFRELTLRATQTNTPVEQIFPAPQRLISATDSSGKITYCNDEFTKISGYSREELVGIRETVERISGMSQQMAAASEEQAHVADDIARQINNVAGTFDRTAKNANAAVARGGELETTSRGLRALVERFNR